MAVSRNWAVLSGLVGALACGSLAQPLAAQINADAQAQDAPEPGSIEHGATAIASERDVARLRNLEGITLQWIEWDERGDVSIEVDEEGVWRVSGSQVDSKNGGILRIEGRIIEIGEDFFRLEGDILIEGTPDADRRCEAFDIWRFAVTQQRTYYRLREFEWCDYLTDYVDIYFHPDLR